MEKLPSIKSKIRHMATKLILTVEGHLIKAAKEYAEGKGKSLSRLLSDFFEMIKSKKLVQEVELPPTVQSLKGVLKGHSVSKKDYKKYIEEKYQ